MIEGEQWIGKEVILKCRTGSFFARGQVVAYCAAPTVVIQTEGGEKISWVADLCELDQQAIQQGAATDALPPP